MEGLKYLFCWITSELARNRRPPGATLPDLIKTVITSLELTSVIDMVSREGPASLILHFHTSAMLHSVHNLWHFGDFENLNFMTKQFIYYCNISGEIKKFNYCKNGRIIQLNMKFCTLGVCS